MAEYAFDAFGKIIPHWLHTKKWLARPIAHPQTIFPRKPGPLQPPPVPKFQQEVMMNWADKVSKQMFYTAVNMASKAARDYASNLNRLDAIERRKKSKYYSKK